jgi:hypothetical protein
MVPSFTASQFSQAQQQSFLQQQQPQHQPCFAPSSRAQMLRNVNAPNLPFMTPPPAYAPPLQPQMMTPLHCSLYPQLAAGGGWMVNSADVCTIAPFPLFVVDVLQANNALTTIMGPSQLLQLNGMAASIAMMNNTPTMTMIPNNKNNNNNKSGRNRISAGGNVVSVGGGANVSATSMCSLSSSATRHVLMLSPTSVHRPTTALVDTNSVALSARCVCRTTRRRHNP